MTATYSLLVTRLATALSALSTSYAGLVVNTSVFRPSNLPAFTRYCLVVSPNVRPWDELRHSIGAVQAIHRVDLYCLVKHFDEVNPLFGTTAGSLGLFQLVEDVKGLLRGNTLSGLVAETYDEPGGDQNRLGAGGIDFGDQAATGFESGEYTFVYRARIPYQARMQPFTHPRN